MTTFLTDEGKLAMRLPPDELAEFIVKHRTDHPFVYKTVMKDFAIIPAKMFKDAKEAAKLLQRSDAAAAAGKVGKARKKATKKKTAKKKTAKKKTTKKKTAKKKTAKKKTAKKKTAKKNTAKKKTAKKKTTKKKTAKKKTAKKKTAKKKSARR